MYDSVVPALYISVSRGGAKTFYVRYRHGGKEVKRKLGAWGNLTPADAREVAREVIASAILGRDSRAAATPRTVAELCEAVMAADEPRLSPATIRSNGASWRLYIAPELGRKLVRDVTWADVDRLASKVALRSKSQADLAVKNLAKAFELAQRWGWMPDSQPNPAKGHKKRHKVQPGQALGREAVARLGKALAESDAIPARAIETMLLTGLRPSEVCALSWADIDGQVIRLPASKTGPRKGYLGAEALAVVQGMRGGHRRWVFPGRRDHVRHYADCWYRARGAADIARDVKLYHATRHTFISIAANMGVAEEIRRALAGHSGRGVHAGYTHLDDETLAGWADRVAGEVWSWMRGEGKVLEWGASG